MKIRKIVLVTLILFIFVFSSVVSGDVIGPGQKSIDWSYELRNTSGDSGYVFFLSDPIPGNEDPSEIIEPGEKFSFYYNGKPKIYAIKKDQFNRSGLGSLSADDPRLIHTGAKLYPSANVFVTSSLKSVETILKVKEISGDSMVIDKVVMYDFGFYSEKRTFDGKEKPSPSFFGSVLGWLFNPLVFIPIVSILLILLILWRRKKS